MGFMNKICELINENLELKIDSHEIDVNDSLISLGMDSISFIKLVTAIEMEFNIEIEDEYLFIETIDTKQKINKLLESIMKNDKF